MPELPEVETVKNTLIPLVKDKVIIGVDIFYDRLIQSNIDDFKKDIINKKILGIQRYGKYLFFDLSDDFILITHLRMEGKFAYHKTNENIRKSWSELVGGYIAERGSLAGLVVVMDARRPFMPTDEWLIDFMRARPEVKMHWLLNKADQLKTMQKRETLRMAKKRAEEFGPNVSVQLFSGLKKEGTEELAAVLEGWLVQAENAAASSVAENGSEG